MVISTRRSSGRLGVALLLCAALLGLCLPELSSARPDQSAVLSPLGMTIDDAPNPVLGADGRNHLAYEITVVNQSSSAVRLDRVQPRTTRGRFGPALDGAELESLLRVNGDGGPEIPAGGSALLFMDVTYARKAAPPKRLVHGFDMTLISPLQPDQKIGFIGVPTQVRRTQAIEVASPLRGSGWVVGNGCCNPINAHRGATLSIDGTVHVPERFAIDFVQLNQNDRLFQGPIDQLSSYAYFGQKIYSVAAGKVVGVQDDQPEQVPGSLPTGQTVQTAGGNYVVVKIDRRHYAFYAHMQPGSQTVKRGDRVRKGQVLGLLGNTGNSDAPHLHFHIMDGPSPLQSNGLPFVYDRFTADGRVTSEAALAAGSEVPIDRDDLAGRFRDRMPLGNQVLNFRP